MKVVENMSRYVKYIRSWVIDPALASCHMLRLSAAVVRAVHGKPGSEPFWRCFFKDSVGNGDTPQQSWQLNIFL